MWERGPAEHMHAMPLRSGRRVAALAALTALVALLAAVALASCAGGTADDGRPSVVASTGLIAEFAARVAGEDARVTALIPSGVDVHTFEPSPDAVRRIVGADLVLVNGYRLEEGVLDVILENRAAGTPLVTVSEGIEPLGGAAPSADASAEELALAAGDPHFWLDPANAARYVARIRDALVAVDPEHAAGYGQRAEALLAELATLGAELEEALAVIPEPRRRLVVFHDAFAYFARAMRLELVTTVAPVSPGREPSARAVAAVVEAVREERVPAVFREPQFSSGVLDLVAEEAGVPVLTLYSVPVPGEVDGYVEMMRANARALVDGLAGPQAAQDAAPAAP